MPETTNKTVTFSPQLVAQTGGIGNVLRQLMDDQVRAVQDKLNTQFKAGQVPKDAVKKILDAFVSLEGTKLPRSRTELAFPGFSDQLVLSCLQELTNARLLREYEQGMYELAHDTLAAEIASRRDQSLVAMREAVKLVQNGYENHLQTGKSYLDFTSGWGVTCLGHAHPALLDALNRQAMRLIQGPNAGFTYSPERARLLQTMRSILPAHLARVYFCNSGAEANDAVLKLARKLTGRCKVVSTLGSFHGRSMATLSVSRGPENPARFLPKTDATEFIPYGDSTALHQAIDDNTAALIVEPVQGEGGVQIPATQWL